MMRVLIACEHSGVVRRAFRARGHDAWSCDLLPSADDSPYHFQDNVRHVVTREWHMMIAHPDCTYLTGSAAWALKDGPYHLDVKPETLTGKLRREAQQEALDFVRWLLSLPIEYIAIENPPGAIGTQIMPASQYIQPHQFGADASKKTGLWLKNLPPLTPTKKIPGRWVKDPRNGKLVERWANQTDSGQNRLPPTADRWALRAETYPGIADAMADQWGCLDLKSNYEFNLK